MKDFNWRSSWNLKLNVILILLIAVTTKVSLFEWFIKFSCSVFDSNRVLHIHSVNFFDTLSLANTFKLLQNGNYLIWDRQKNRQLGQEIKSDARQETRQSMTA